MAGVLLLGAAAVLVLAALMPEPYRAVVVAAIIVGAVVVGAFVLLLYAVYLVRCAWRWARRAWAFRPRTKASVRNACAARETGVWDLDPWTIQRLTDSYLNPGEDF
jgi:hypothetical protein